MVPIRIQSVASYAALGAAAIRIAGHPVRLGPITACGAGRVIMDQRIGITGVANARIPAQRVWAIVMGCISHITTRWEVRQRHKP